MARLSASILGMTGFSRPDGAAAERNWAWEARRIIRRGLDFLSRSPPGYDQLVLVARAPPHHLDQTMSR